MGEKNTVEFIKDSIKVSYQIHYKNVGDKIYVRIPAFKMSFQAASEESIDTIADAMMHSFFNFNLLENKFSRLILKLESLGFKSMSTADHSKDIINFADYQRATKEFTKQKLVA